MTFPSVSEAGLPASAPGSAGRPASAAHAAAAAEFGQWMSGLAPAASRRDTPSLMGSVVRVSAAVSDRAMASLTTPPPPGLSLTGAIAFYAQKQVDVNNMKAFENLAVAAARITRKTFDTVLNSK